MTDIEIRLGDWRATAFEYQGELYWHIFGPWIGDGFIDAVSGKGINELRELAAKIKERIKQEKGANV